MSLGPPWSLAGLGLLVDALVARVRWTRIWDVGSEGRCYYCSSHSSKSTTTTVKHGLVWTLEISIGGKVYVLVLVTVPYI